MARHLDLRNHGNMAFCSIFHKGFQLFLCVISAVCTGRALFHVRPVAVPPGFPVCFRPPGGIFRQSRPGLNLHSPARGIRQVKMQPVHLEHSHRINLLLYEVNAEEMP